MKINTLEVHGFESSMAAMRMPYENGLESDSIHCSAVVFPCEECLYYKQCGGIWKYYIGMGDMELCERLIKAGSDHRKFLRSIQVWAEINAPRYWWQEMDTYKIGTACSSSSTMHLITKRKFTQDDFENEISRLFIAELNDIQSHCLLKDNQKKRLLKAHLPESFLQKRIMLFSYEALLNIYRQRKNHELPQWHTFCKWVESLPYMKGFLNCVSIEEMNCG